jgi:3-deoxy-manno-octulosonate cytidylyltransferase (CMP-KDO synthetase)
VNVVGIIPARWASSRFPGKVMVPICGQSMLERVWRGARACQRLRDVIVATDDERIACLCESFGARVEMTSASHATGTDRIAEVAARLDDDVIVNIQGDEPLIEPFVIEAVVDALLKEPRVPMSTVAHRVEVDAVDDPNRVKVVLDRDGLALYFSRSPIPYASEATCAPARFQHVGLYAYGRDFLQQFVKLPRGAAEASERLEQLRALEGGYRIRVGIVEGWRSVAVDVPGDVAAVEAALQAKT